MRHVRAVAKKAKELITFKVKKDDLSFILESSRPHASLAEKQIWLEQLIIWIRAEASQPSTRIKFILQVLERQPQWKSKGNRKEDLPFVHFTMNYAMFEIQKAFEGIFMNLEVPGLTWFFKGPIRWWGNVNALASEDNDKHTHKIATLITTDSEQRDRLTAGIFIPKSVDEAVGRLEATFKVVKRAEAAELKIRKAIKTKQLPKRKIAEIVDQAVSMGIISADEKADLIRSEEMRNHAIQVDDFSQDEYVGHPGWGPSKSWSAPSKEGPRLAK